MVEVVTQIRQRIAGFETRQWTRVIPYLTHLALALAAGRAVIGGEIRPFGFAFFAATRWMKPRLAWPTALAVVAGAMSGDMAAAPVEVLSTIAFHFVMVRAGAGKERARLPAVSAIAGLTWFTVRLLQASLDGLYLYPVLLHLLESFIVSAAVWVFTAYKRDREQVPVISGIVAVIVLIGLAGLNLWNLSLIRVAGVFFTAWAGRQHGVYSGATAGLLSGSVVALATGHPVDGALVFALGGLGAGLARDIRPGFAWPGYLAGAFFALFALPLQEEASVHLFPWAAVAPAFLALHKLIPLPSRERDAARQEFLTRRLQEFAKIFSEMAQSFEQISCSESESGDEYSLGQMIRRTSAKVCSGCTRESKCWEKDFYHTYRLFFDLVGVAENNGVLSRGKIPDEFRDGCLRLDAVTNAVNQGLELYRTNYLWQQRLRDARDLVSVQLKGISQIMDNMALEAAIESRAGIERRSPVRGRFRVGVALMAKDGQSQSGDAYICREIGADEVLVAISDGMGAGQRAALESRAALGLLDQMLSSGFDLDTAVRTINSTLILRSKEETYATVDILSLDLTDYNARFAKIGAAPSFIVRGKEVMVVKSASLPIGILQNVDIETSNRALRPKDLVVMISDGLLEAARENVYRDEWISSYLRHVDFKDPQTLAESLLEQALTMQGHKARDDMTVVVLKIG